MDARIHKGTFEVGSKTESGGTQIIALIAPLANAWAKILQIVYEAAATAHTISILRAQGSTTTSAAAAAGQADMVLTDVSTIKNVDGSDATETLAANDFLVFKCTDGSWAYGKISSISGSTVTLTANLDKAVASGATVWKMHQVSRPATASGRHSVDFLTKASTTNTFGEAGSADHAIAKSSIKGSPLLLVSDNSTNAGFLRNCYGIYTSID